MTVVNRDGVNLDVEPRTGAAKIHYPRVMSSFYGQVLGILPEKLAEIQAFLRIKAAGGEVAEERVAEVVAARRNDGVSVIGKVAILPVFGVLAHRIGGLEAMSGGISTERLGAQLDGLMDDKSIKTIVMAFDSPGGSVFGIPELADKIRRYRDEKKIIGIADPMAASAAYWLLSQTSEIYVTPSGQVGSIGVLVAHTDVTEWEAKNGYKTTMVASSPFKLEGYPEVPLTDEARSEMQAKVNHYHGEFVAAIARGRGISEGRVSSDFGQGRMVTSKEAVSRGMADKVGTLETLLRRLGAEVGGPGVAAEAAEQVGVQAKMAAARARALEVKQKGD